MKKTLLLLGACGALLGLFAQTPTAPVLVSDLPPAGVTITNITTIHTNVYVISPYQQFLGPHVYRWTNALRKATVISWDLGDDPTAISNVFYYGRVGLSETNTLQFGSNLTSIAFVNYLNTNYTYWFMIKARNSSGIESEPSNILISSPKPYP